MVVPQRRPRLRRALSEAEILDTALALLDAGGPEAATIRRIAAAVGTAPNTVYTYFPDQTAVQDALIERLLGGIAAGTEGTDWRSDVESMALALRCCLVRHPGVVPLMLRIRPDGPNALRLGECLLDRLTAGGLGAEAAARGAYLVVVYVLGAVALEVADVPHPGALPPEEERIAARLAALGAVPSEDFPRTAAATGVAATWIGTDQFRWGLRRLLSGLMTMVPEPF